MKKHIICGLISLFCSFGYSQVSIQVVDEFNLLGLANVQVTGIQTYSTDKYGNIKVSDKERGLVFSHPDFLTAKFSMEQLRSLNFQVTLKSNVNTLDETVVSASRSLEKKKDVAQKIQVLRSADMQIMNQSSMADVLANSGSVFVQKSQLGGGSPIIRGFETNKVLLVIDGVRMNNAIYRGGHLQNVITLDNSIMDRTEIVFGPGSVVYGSDAIGGVMSFTTKKPILSTDDAPTVKAGAYTRYFSAANGYAAHANVSVGGKQFGSLTSFTFSSFGDLRQGARRSPFVGNFGARNWYVDRIVGKDTMITNADSNLQVGSGYQQYDVLQKFIYKQNEFVTHQLNIQLSNSGNIDRYDRLTLLSGGLPKFAEWYYGPQFRLLTAYTFEYTKSNRWFDGAKIIASYQAIEESRMDRRYHNLYRNHRIERLKIPAMNLDFTKKINKHEIRYGAEFYYNDVRSQAYTENIEDGTTDSLDTRYPDGGSSMFGAAAYATHTWELSEKLIVNDGLRFSYAGLDALFNSKTFFPFPFPGISQSHQAVNGNLGLIYSPKKNWRFTLNASTGFRAPNVDDLTKVFESVPGKIVVPNPSLKPEYSYNLDFGMIIPLTERIYLGGNTYFTYLTNALNVRDAQFNGQDSILYDGQMSLVMTTVNSGKAFVYGAEGVLTGQMNDHFTINVTVNFTKGRIMTDSVPYPLDHIPPVFGKFSLVYQLKAFRAEGFVQYSGWKRLEDYNLIGEDNYSYAIPEGMPSWYTLNLRLNYTFNRFVSFQAACENILDQNYRLFASNISAPGRNFILTLRGNF